VATILKPRGEDMKTAQELMRHNSSITRNLYARAVAETKRSAQSKARFHRKILTKD
jgi:hypothetical protein